MAGESVEFCLTTFTLTDTEVPTGTWECSFDKVDSDAQTILMTRTDSTGSLAGLFGPDGEKVYWFYNIIGGDLWLGFSFSGYPSSAPYGPYKRE
jgi:hypothetical protein